MIPLTQSDTLKDVVLSQLLTKANSDDILPQNIRNFSNQIIEADLTLIDGKFHSGIRIKCSSEGKILQIGADIPESEVTVRLKHQAILPGMINTHSHAFQRGLRGKYNPARQTGKTSFWSWRAEMYKLVESMTQEQLFQLSFQAFKEMIQAGITTVGEFHYLHHSKEVELSAESISTVIEAETASNLNDGSNSNTTSSYDQSNLPMDSISNEKLLYDFDEVILRAAKVAGIRILLILTYYEKPGVLPNTPLLSAQKHFVSPSLETFWKNFDSLSMKLDTATQTLGIAAHSFRAVDLDHIIALKKESDRRKIPFHIHLEEQPQEIKDCEEILKLRPAEGVLKFLNPNEHTTLVHCTHTKPEHLTELRERGVNISIAPLTEGHLGDGLPEIQNITSAEIPFYISIGSDCNARICFMEEMRWLLYGQQVRTQKLGCPSLQECNGKVDSDMASDLFRVVTLNGARSLGLKDVGQLAEKKWLDCYSVDLAHPSLYGWEKETLLDAIIFGTSGGDIIKGVWVAGELKHFQIRLQ